MESMKCVRTHFNTEDEISFNWTFWKSSYGTNSTTPPPGWSAPKPEWRLICPVTMFCNCWSGIASTFVLRSFLFCSVLFLPDQIPAVVHHQKLNRALPLGHSEIGRLTLGWTLLGAEVESTQENIESRHRAWFGHFS